MSFDAQSLERLRQLGRTLPQRLPAQEPPATATAPSPGAPGAGGGRHRLETETDPEALFHELMQASTDGHIPAHLLERMKNLEAVRRGQRAGKTHLGSKEKERDSQLYTSAQGKRNKKKYNNENDNRDAYIDFRQLLMEEN